MVLSKKELGALVKKARQYRSKKIGKKYTQAMLAEDIGRSQSYIGDIESGRSYPSLAVLTDIAKACGVPLSFFEGSELEVHYGELESLLKADIAEAMREALDKDMDKIVTSLAQKNNLTYKEAKKQVENLIKTKDDLYSLFMNLNGKDFILRLSEMIIKENIDKANKNEQCTLAAHRIDGYDDDLPEEAKEELKNFIDYLKVKYKKRDESK